MCDREHGPDDGDCDFTPDQWDDAEQYPWDCDLQTSWFIEVDDD